jgi:hypothetical protein
MTLSFLVRTCAAGTLAFGTVVFAHETVRAQGGAAAAPQQSTTTEQQITVAGCIQREADYRKARDAGKGGVVGTGVGAGNEFVLVNTAMAASAGSPSPGATAGTAGTTGAAYELTGANEKQAEQFVGKRVEISGKLKAAETAAGQPTGGPTAGKPPTGVDVAGGDLKLRELEVTSVKAAASGTCPAL